MKKILLIIAVCFMLFSCTENQRAKSFGGTGTYEIPYHEMFVNVTWKENNLWILTKKRTESDTTKSTYVFTEKSNWGVANGKFIIIEK